MCCLEVPLFPLHRRDQKSNTGGSVRSIGHEHDFCQAQKVENTDPRTNYAVKYVTARGHLTQIANLGSEKKHIKKKTRKQNFHGIVPGFWGEFCFYVFFLPHKENDPKNTT